MGIILVCTLIGFGIGLVIAISRGKIRLSSLSLAAFLGAVGRYIYQSFNKYQSSRRG